MDTFVLSCTMPCTRKKQFLQTTIRWITRNSVYLLGVAILAHEQVEGSLGFHKGLPCLLTSRVILGTVWMMLQRYGGGAHYVLVTITASAKKTHTLSMRDSRIVEASSSQANALSRLILKKHLGGG